jgi:Uma2 family endonuclease
MASALPQKRLSPQEYLAIERDCETRHQYYRGEMFAMSGASREHNLLATSLSAELYNALRGKPCEVYSSDMRVKVPTTGLYTYPDVVVTCEKPRFEDDHFDTLLNPQVVIEVLSDSTESYDRGRKFEQYREIESFRDYLLVSQKRPHIEHYTRQEDGWLLTEARDLSGSISIASIGCTLKLADVYAKIEFPEDTGPEEGSGIFRA